MKLLSLPAAALSLIGRHGTFIAASSIFVGLAVPPLAAAFKPYLGPAIVVLLTFAFLRVDPVELIAHVKRPRLLLLAIAWMMLVVPAVLGTLFLAVGVERATPGLFFILILQISASGLMSSPATASLLGLDTALTLACLILASVIAPLTAGLFTHVFLGRALASPLMFGLRLFAIIAGSALGAAVIRRLVGSAFVQAQRVRIDGLSVLTMFVFAVAAMDGVTAHIRAEPLTVLGLLALAFVLALGLIALTTLCFLPAGRSRALAVGWIVGNRNIGLMLAATGFSAPDVAWLYFALAQFPIYLLPHLLRPLARHLQQTKRIDAD